MKRESIAEVPSVELHGQVRMPVLEAARDEAIGPVDVLEDVFVAVASRPCTVGVEQDIAHRSLPTTVVQDRVAVADRGVVAHGVPCSP